MNNGTTLVKRNETNVNSCKVTNTFTVLMTQFLLTKAVYAQTCKACDIQ